MNTKKNLKEKIVRSVFLYETQKLTLDTIGRVIVFCISIFSVLIFGGVVIDIFRENEWGDTLTSFFLRGEYSIRRLGELLRVFMDEIPLWIILVYLSGLLLGCILIILIIVNGKVLYHKINSLFHYWFHL